MNNPKEIHFTNGNRTEYIYSASGEKLRTIHRTAVANMGFPIGVGVPLTPALPLSVDSTDYIGNFIFRNGKVDKFLFNGGYCSFTSDNQPVYHYYTQDHLGNNRAVVNEDGTLEQVTHYYPFGDVYGDAGLNASAQPYKYNGKELDRMYRLDWYDYGARSYDAVVPQFTTMDKYCEKYYNLSPYSYAANNPINVVDINGDSLKIMDINLIMAIYNGIKNKDVHLKFNNGVLDPNSIRKEAEKGDDFFINDLFEISNSDKMIEMYANKTNTYLDEKGNKQSNMEWGTAPYITNDYDDGPTTVNYLKANGQPVGSHVQGCTGQTLLPLPNIPRRSTNNNIQVIIYNSNITNCMTVGIAHELGHVLLYLHHKPSGHGHPGVDDFVYDRATKMSRRLGYDY